MTQPRARSLTSRPNQLAWIARQTLILLAAAFAYIGVHGQSDGRAEVAMDGADKHLQGPVGIASPEPPQQPLAGSRIGQPADDATDATQAASHSGQGARGTRARRPDADGIRRRRRAHHGARPSTRGAEGRNMP